MTRLQRAGCWLLGCASGTVLVVCGLFYLHHLT